MSRQRISVVAVAALLIGGAVLPPPSRAGDPEPANPGAATDGRYPEVRLLAEELRLPSFDHPLLVDRAPESAIGGGRLRIGVTVWVAVDGKGRVVDAASGPVRWYEPRDREWIAGAGPHDVVDAPEIQRAAEAGAIMSQFHLPREANARRRGIYRGQVEFRWEVPAGKPLHSGPVLITRGPHHDIGFVAVVPVASGVVTTPRLLHKVSPRYPEDALARRAEGLVVLQATIDESGRVVDVGVLAIRGDAAEFPSIGESAMDAVRQWRYEPARKEGWPVKVHFTITIEFSFTGTNPNEFPLH